jgi:hypothetical protein
MVKAATEAMNSRTWPNRRDNQPVNAMQIALAIAKEVIIHSPSSGLTPRLPEMVGTETFAMVMSTTDMNEAKAMLTAANARVVPKSGVTGSLAEGLAISELRCWRR